MDASAITQETLFQVAKSIPDYRGSKDPQFKAWIRRILINKVTDVIRKSKKVTSLDSTGPHGPRRNLVLDNSSSPSHKVNRMQQRVLINSALEEALNKLPGDQAQAVSMRYIEGLSIPDISIQLVRSEVATRQLIRRGIVRLGEFLPDNLKENLS